MKTVNLRPKIRASRIPPVITWVLIIASSLGAGFLTSWIVHNQLMLDFPWAVIIGVLVEVALIFPIIYFSTMLPLANQLEKSRKLQAQMRLQITALETSKNGVVITDKDGNIQWVNSAFTQITGYPLDEVVGQNPRFLKSGKQDVAYYEKMWDTILSGQTWLGQLINRRKDGRLYNEEMVIAPSVDEHGNITNFIGVKQDITALVQIEQQLESEIQQHLLLSAVEKNHQELANGLAQATQALSEGMDVEKVLDRVLQQARRIIPYLGATIALIDDNRILHIIKASGFETRPEMHAYYENTSFNLDDYPILQEIARSLQPVLIDDTTLAPEWVVVPGLEWVRTNLLAPLIIDGKMIGLATMMDDKPNAFRADMIDRIVAFSVPAAIAIQLARSYSSEQSARQAADTLSAASRALTQSLDIDVVLDRLLELIQNLMPFDEGCVAILEGAEHIRVVAVRGSEDWPAPTRLLEGLFPIKEWPHIKKAISTRQALFIPDTREYPGWKPFFGPHALNWLGIPVHFDDNTFGIMMVIKSQPHFFTQEQARLAEALVNQATIAMQNAWLFTEVRGYNERLQYMSHRLVEVQENQLRYIAEELHDEVGQVLTSLVLELRAIDKSADQPAAVRTGVQRMGQVLDNVMEDLHRLSIDLHPASLDHLGLEAALRQHIALINEKEGTQTRFEMIGIPQRLPARMEIAIYRIVQEALNNVLRHASASQAEVLIQRSGDDIFLIVEDNGVGFNPAAAEHGDRLGLFGIRERAEMLGGKLTIDSAEGKGTTLRVEVPYANPDTHRR